MSESAPEPAVDFQVAQDEDLTAWYDKALRELDINEWELERQARTGRFQSDRARRVWMATVNGIPRS